MSHSRPHQPANPAAPLSPHEALQRNYYDRHPAFRASLGGDEEEVDLRDCPLQQQEEEESHNGREATLGDLHGNAIKLLFFLVKEGVLKVEPEDYDALMQYYQQYALASAKANKDIARYDDTEKKLEKLETLKNAPQTGYGTIDQDSLEKIIAQHTQSLLNIDNALKEVFDEIAEINLYFRKMLREKYSVNAQAATQLVRFMGDELCDRGRSDWFTLLIFGKLMSAEELLQRDLFKVLASNHGLEAVLYFEAVREIIEFNQSLPANQSLPDDQVLLEAIKHEGILDMDPNEQSAVSLQNFIRDVDCGLILDDEGKKFTAKDILSFFKDVYFPHLVLLDYTLSADQQDIVLYTHAPSDLNVIKALAAQFKVAYHDDTAVLLAASIDRINEAFKKYVEEGRVHEIFKRDEESALTQLVWNRDYAHLQREPQQHQKLYHIYFVHGHDHHGPDSAHVAGLDDPLGKPGHYEYEGIFSTFSCPAGKRATLNAADSEDSAYETEARSTSQSPAGSTTEDEGDFYSSDDEGEKDKHSPH